MHWNKVVEVSKKVVEAGVEKALIAANAAEQVGRRAARSYNYVAERAPFPLPRIPLGTNGHSEEVAAPPAPPAQAKAPTGSVVSTASLLDKAAAKKATAPAKPAPVPMKPAPAAKAAPAAKPAPATPAAAAPATKAPAKKAPAKGGARKLPTYNTMTKKMRKAELQDLCRELGVAVTGDETANQLADEVVKLGAKG